LSETKETKTFGKGIVVALGIICIIMVACLSGVIAGYTLIVNEKSNTISSLKSQISELNSNVTNLENQIAFDGSRITSLASNVTSLKETLKTALNNPSYMGDLIISEDPSAWVNQTVIVEGTINLMELSYGAVIWTPWDYTLSFNGTTIGISWNGNIINGENVTIVGVVAKGQVKIMHFNGVFTYFDEYFIEAESIEPL
jgi:hypothetical protein